MTAEISSLEGHASDEHGPAEQLGRADVIEPMTIKCIVVPLDGSALAEEALSLALTLARATRATVRAVHVFVPLPTGTVVHGLADYSANVEAQLASDAGAYVDDVRRRFGTIEGALEILHADLSRASPPMGPFGEAAPTVAALERYCRMHRADLIVMTSHGRGGFSRAWMGNVADALLRGTGIPVLIVRPDDTPTTAHVSEQILVAVDGSALAERVLPVALTIASIMRARITLTHVVTVRWVVARASPVSHIDTIDLARQQREADAYLQELRSRVRAPGVSVETRVVEEPVTMLPEAGPARALLKTIEATGAGMIALATHGHGGFKRWLLGSVADKVVRAAPVATLVLRAESDRPGHREPDTE